MISMASISQLQTTLFLMTLIEVTKLFCGCYGHQTYYYITPDPETSCGEDHEPCLTLDQFASMNISKTATLVLIPGHHRLSRNIEIFGVDHLSILSNTSVTIQCTSPASFLFEGISNLDVRNTAIVSCGGGGSSGAVQVRSVQQFIISNVTLQESACDSLNVQDSKGLVTGARFIGNTGAGLNIENSEIKFEGSNTFSDNLRHAISSYNNTLQFIGVSQFTNNTNFFLGSDGGAILAIRSTINFSGKATFANNSAPIGGGGGGGVYAYGTRMTSEGQITFVGNKATQGGGICVGTDATLIIIGTSDFISNSALIDGGGVCAYNNAAVDISGPSSFTKNSAERFGGAFSMHKSTVNLNANISFTWNLAKVRGGGMYVEANSIVFANEDSLFSDNWSRYGGGISLKRSEIYFRGNTIFSSNRASYGGAIQAVEANVSIEFSGNGSFIKNHANVNGGAIALGGVSFISIDDTAFLNFVENIANNQGGAIFYEDNAIHCSYDWDIIGFIQLYVYWNFGYSCVGPYPEPYSFGRCKVYFKIHFAHFSGNSAQAGSVIFGGEIDKTLVLVNNMHLEDFNITVGHLLDITTSTDNSNSGSLFSSNPKRICRCINGQPDCSDPPSPHELSVYPGQTVGVSLVAVGQRNGIVPSTINAVYDPDDGATFGYLQSTQKSTTACTELRYTIFSAKVVETIKIFVEGTCGAEGIPLSVNVMLQNCPIGFTLFNSSNQCVCEERLRKYTQSCNISNQEITRTASDTFWVGVDNTNETEGLILHPHCPFDYCHTNTVRFTLVESSGITFTDTNKTLNSTNTVWNGTDSETNSTLKDAKSATMNDNIDVQCNYNRSGLLCGKCQKDFSLVFGSSKCQKCSNSYLSLLVALALAGFILVIFLLILKMTVAVGTINGLIFYANIISVNRAQLFPSGETNILTVFIAWVNLDLGIETCFFDGMDAYSKAWLQYAFPLYVWVLVGAIIIAGHHSTRVARCLGTNPVAVLATLFLLSYAKLLRSIINPLFVTFLEYPSDSKAVWLVDGNVAFLKGKHIPIFLVSLLALLLLFIPFTLLLLLGQWIQSQSERKCCSWISDYRVSTFLDVYHGPFKNKHRYWSGLLLATRICLFMVFAFNVNGDPRVNILATIVCLIGLLIVFSWFRVYKAWYLNALEASFIINSLLLNVASGIYYVEMSGENQNTLTYASVSVAFATFCGIVFYHCCLQIRGTMLFKSFVHSLKKSTCDINGVENTDIEEDPPRKYTKPPTTSVVEITM